MVTRQDQLDLKPEKTEGRGRGRGRGKGQGKGRGKGRGRGKSTEDKPKRERSSRSTAQQAAGNKRTKEVQDGNKPAKRRSTARTTASTDPNAAWEGFIPWGADGYNEEWDGYVWDPNVQTWIWDSMAFWSAREASEALPKESKSTVTAAKNRRKNEKEQKEPTDPTGSSAAENRKSSRKKKGEPTNAEVGESEQAAPAKRARQTKAKKNEKRDIQPEGETSDTRSEHYVEILTFLKEIRKVPEEDQGTWMRMKLYERGFNTCKFSNVYWTRRGLGIKCIKEGKDVATISCNVKGCPPNFKMAAVIKAAHICVTRLCLASVQP